nr:ATP-dependent DNA helicase [Asticcacaulis tiandongensis]
MIESPPAKVPDADQATALRSLLPPQGFALTPVSAVMSDGRMASPIGIPQARELWGREGLLVANAPLIRQRLFSGRQHREARHFDLLELFAFVRPARFCAPSVAGLALAVGYSEPEDTEAQARILAQVALALGRELTEAPLAFRLMARASLQLMAENGWVWAPFLEACLAQNPVPEGYVSPPALQVWSLLDEWEDQAPAGDARQVSLTPEEVTTGLWENLGRAGLSERRKEQLSFAQKTRDIFGPKWATDQPNMLLLEAGTGTGKTLGYLSPAHQWAQKSQGRVWVSTYTKALQKQIFNDTRALFATEAERDNHIAIRKGRENYLCLLNYQERLGPLTQGPGETIIAALLARWVIYSRDGDIVGGDFPTWLPSLLPPQSAAAMFGALNPSSLVDRRGECIYSACQHYRTCFVEKSIRKAKSARIIIANHALVMAQAAYDLSSGGTGEKGSEGEPEAPGLSRLVFDEGHHVFEAADGAFSSELSGLEAYELRRWIRGNEGRGRRTRGLEQRLGDLLATRETAQNHLKDLMRAAAVLPHEGWSQRLTTRTRSGEMMEPVGPIEALLAAVLKQIDVRQQEAAPKSRYRPDDHNAECEAHPCLPEVAEAAATAAKAVQGIEAPLLALVRSIEDVLTSEEDIDLGERARLDGALRGLERRARITLPAWRSLLQQLAFGEDTDPATPSPFVDWFATIAHNGKLVDAALHRHFVDPSLPLANYVLKPAHGVLMASATLSDASQQPDIFALARQRTGAAHLALEAGTLRIASPFDYEQQARLFVVTDVPRDDPRAVASAMKALFLASKGGGLGLFTAIRRLKTVYEHLYKPLGENGISLYAQHIDPLDVSDLISVFRSEHHSCLLGTDAVRDGIDVPGQALRLIAFDRVPWPRPDALHKARRVHFGQKLYDDALVRSRLAQAFGRLIRKKDDRGVFVMLDSAAPTRLFDSLPEGVVLQRVTLAEAIAGIEAFLLPSVTQQG